VIVLGEDRDLRRRTIISTPSFAMTIDNAGDGNKLYDSAPVDVPETK
jgi:hypothetical protein